MSKFDYTAFAELYPSKTLNKSRKIRYQRFTNAADAVRFAVEDMPAELLRGSMLEVGDQRFESAQIRALYDAEDYPLERKLAA